MTSRQRVADTAEPLGRDCAGRPLRHRLRRVLTGAALALSAVLALSPLHVSAHSFLVSSVPADGAQLGLAPGAVVLDYSEALNLKLSQAGVFDPAGRSTTARPISATEIRVDLITNIPGKYAVRWTAVSRDDGHITTGNPHVHGRGARQRHGDDGRWRHRWRRRPGGGARVEDASLLLAVDMLLIAWLGRQTPRLDWVRPRLRIPLVVAFVVGCIVITTEGLTATDGSVAALPSYSTPTSPGSRGWRGCCWSCTRSWPSPSGHGTCGPRCLPRSSHSPPPAMPSATPHSGGD